MEVFSRFQTIKNKSLVCDSKLEYTRVNDEYPKYLTKLLPNGSIMNIHAQVCDNMCPLVSYFLISQKSVR